MAINTELLWLEPENVIQSYVLLLCRDDLLRVGLSRRRWDEETCQGARPTGSVFSRGKQSESEAATRDTSQIIRKREAVMWTRMQSSVCVGEGEVENYVADYPRTWRRGVEVVIVVVVGRAFEDWAESSSRIPGVIVGYRYFPVLLGVIAEYHSMAGVDSTTVTSCSFVGRLARSRLIDAFVNLASFG
ncbi:hypothetical protein BDY19DRAFT_904405 [Irpex rosettiformis]|uniref:Uncharacterized protein n=1 Tax=Irpex rosettiformis TaxID=378272 RepID=A0ACB8UC11_9APHY|nr:hypothetical protein BDY19DRAFT_904405 [Irpex rosettiformis]